MWSSSLFPSHLLGIRSSYGFYLPFKKVIIWVGFKISISWCGHQVHISVPINRLLDSGVDSFTLGCQFTAYLLLHARVDRVDNISESCVEVNSITGSVFLDQITAHHFYLGIVFISSRILSDYRDRTLTNTARNGNSLNNWHAQLSINLAVTASLSH